jgi:hypothetical protein
MKLLSLVSPYLAWFVSSVLVVIDGIALRTAAAEIAAWIADAVPREQQAERGWFLFQAIPAADKCAVAILGVAALALVLSLDFIYRAARAKGVLWRRFGVITAIQVAVLAGCGIVILVL